MRRRKPGRPRKVDIENEQRPKLAVIIVGGEPEAREAVASLIKRSLQVWLSVALVDTTFVREPDGSEAAGVLGNHLISVRDGGG